MITLVIRQGNITQRFNPQKDCDAIYAYLTVRMGWEHEKAEDVLSWAETAIAGAEYYADDPNIRIYLTEDKEEHINIDRRDDHDN